VPRLSTLHKRRLRRRKLSYQVFRAYLYFVAMTEVVSKHTWDFERDALGEVRIDYVLDDLVRNMCHVRIVTSYKTRWGTFRCAFPLSMEMVDDPGYDWQRALRLKVPSMLASYLVRHATKVPELRPIVKRRYKRRR
jgi:hypothetical protein